ncbi:rod shape-determining protein MreC [Weissella diestrammenae]|uniref:Cell shape-determining protein MreC n=1 Tax=Weissella diestrammenae TaxID=1162633 RepID=A0A7G9T648_9LACO|nr:rod shape-determining protein MreC [Weissella diestrammenae]MCM0582411.1 rod shape-determining protein MreC [Weissella diestrammenae]QNN75573.1 rod shape-determining protein MreC [Weissella diestrammenae]
MKKFFSSRRLVVAVIIAILTISVITVSSQAKQSQKEPSIPSRIISDITGWLSDVVSVPIGGVHNGFDSLGNLMNTYSENQKMSARVDELAQAKVQLQVLKAENKALKDQIEINTTLTDYSIVSASVISRSPVNWQSQLIINRGSNAGVQKGMPVMGSGGLIGRIAQVNTTSAKVELLSDNSQLTDRFAIRATNSDGQVVDGIITGFDQSKNEIVMADITSDVKLKKGDLVTTSGLGGVTPAGLYVGKVSSVEANDYGLSKKIYIKPSTDFNNIPVVSVAIPK